MSKRNPTREDFGDLLRDGLSSSRSYVILKHKNRQPVILQFKPFVERLSPSVIYVGGKLSAFPDKTSEKWQALDGIEKQALLAKAWKNLPGDRVSEVRYGSHAGFYLVAPTGQKRKFMEKFGDGHYGFVTKLLNAISEELDVEIENRTQVRAFLKFHWQEELENFFETGGAKVPTRVVGKKSPLLVGQVYAGYGQALTDFQVGHGVDGVKAEAEAA